MNKTFISCVVAVHFFLAMSFRAASQSRYELNTGWLCAPVSGVKEEGTLLSTISYSVAGWKRAVVPGTVLTTMLQNKDIPDPFYGMNNQKIPDIYTTGRDYYTYWFVKEFKERCPESGRQVWLQFRGVNYGCDIYFNGHRLTGSTHKGMFLRLQYNISPYMRKDGINRLAVIVYPPDPVGNPNGGQGGDGMIAKNVSLQYVAGWDWIQPIRDRNTGIWDKVFIEKTGRVNIRDPHIITLVPGARMPRINQEPAIVKVSADLQNTSGKIVHGVLQYTLAGNIISRRVILPANSITTVSLPDCTVKNPELWWPNGYGEQHLYKIGLQFLQNDLLSDEEPVTFGIREIRREWNTVTASSQFSVNGQKIFIKGGNWIISDAMLRLSGQRYDAEIRFHRDMNLNLIRVWGGALLERPEFYDACDKYGLLVFQDLWMSGDCNGRWNDRMKLESREVRRQYPDDHDLFIRSVADGIRLIRNHASLAIWCGGNEITPPDDILRVMKDSLFSRLDGTRTFFEYSNSDSMSKNILHGGGDGPYSIQPVDTFWRFRTYPFNSETGSVGMSDYESLARFIPETNMHVPEYQPAASAGAKAAEKVDSVWSYHKYIGYENYVNAYGKAKDVQDFALKAQLVNYDQYRALMEGFSSHMWQWYTGSIIWKTQNPWTAMRGQMYDYYLDPNACLYGLRSGSEPVHVMYNPVTGSPQAVNNTFDTLHCTLDIKVFDTNGKLTLSKSFPVVALPSSVQTCNTIKKAVDSLARKEGTFLLLRLRDGKAPATENLYWLPDENRQYTGLQKINPARITAMVNRNGNSQVEVTISNPASAPVAFFNRVSLVNAQTTKRILPVFYSDNYISVLPGESKTVTINYTPQAVKLAVSLNGWNVPQQYIPVQ